MPDTRAIVEVGSAAVLAVAGAASFAYAAVSPASQLFGRTLTAPRNPENGPPEIALTFDDGPNPRWTPQLLEILAKGNIRATFFLVGRYAATQHALVRETHAAGHLIGNHTWTHPNLVFTNAKQTREELTRTSAELEQIIGAPVRYFRPPFGMRRVATMRIAGELGLVPITWNVIGNDWNAPSAEAITTRVTRLMDKNLRKGYATNLVLHDGGHLSLEADRSRTVVAAGVLIRSYQSERRFVRVDAWG
ncbi:polysaccharide deacetylase family protein [Acidicapsa ligni]|uniref:polysaccharide deacetylase family protein n=1 Tax=Acidicapsa ligni TaxID=542300 RepID=UPI0021DF494F|nr:polysaccharide deacetylase family protein [Acidicapsa ligni]